ncbi:CBS domain-containing protein [Thermodesulfobacteriota bacterium]
MGDMRAMSRAGLSTDFINSMLENFSLCKIPFTEMCRKAANLKVTDIMYSPSEGEYIEAEASLCEAIHMFIVGNHHSLLVTRDKKIVGVLRLTDVFKEAFQKMESHIFK